MKIFVVSNNKTFFNITILVGIFPVAPSPGIDPQLTEPKLGMEIGSLLGAG